MTGVPIIDDVACPMCGASEGQRCVEKIALSGPAPGAWCNEREWRWHFRHGNRYAAHHAKRTSFRLTKSAMR